MKKARKFLLAKTIGGYLNILSYLNKQKAEEKVYQLFSTPRKGRLKMDRLPKTLHQSLLVEFHHENEKYQSYVWQGDEKSILLLHGWESNSSRWKKTLKYLRPLGHTIIALDAPAHGLSDGVEFNMPKYANIISEFVKKHNPKILIGHSMGGATISYFLHKYKDHNIEKVVILGSPSDFNILAKNYYTLLSLNTKNQQLFENAIQAKFNITISEFSGHLFAKQFTQEALIVHDVNDKIVSVEEGQKYAAAWKNSTFLQTTGLGHGLHDHEVYLKLIAFLSEK